jgi:hypothetical protein
LFKLLGNSAAFGAKPTRLASADAAEEIACANAAGR